MVHLPGVVVDQRPSRRQHHQQQQNRRRIIRRKSRRSSVAGWVTAVVVVAVASVGVASTHHLRMSSTMVEAFSFSTTTTTTATTVAKQRQQQQSRMKTNPYINKRNCYTSSSSTTTGLSAETDDDRMSVVVPSQQGRRDFCKKSIATIFGCFTATATATAQTQQQHGMVVPVADAACLPGDLSKDCIGVYKLPYLDATQSSWLYDKDTLKEFAPDIRYIEVEQQPKTLKEAINQLVTERKKVKLIKDVILEGDLEQAGTIILNLIPKVTSAGLKVQQDLYDDNNNNISTSSPAGAVAVASSSSSSATAMNEIKRRKFDNSLQIVIAEWSSIDIAIGQAIRGQRGVTAVAQIEILSYLKDATVALDDFITLINEERENITTA